MVAVPRCAGAQCGRPHRGPSRAVQAGARVNGTMPSRFVLLRSLRESMMMRDARAWSLALAFLAVSPASSAPGARGTQQPSFVARVESVRVDALVLDGGRPVRGLGPADFDISDNGVP